MAEKEVLLTGSKGVIGTILQQGLQPAYNVRPFDLPENDARHYNQVRQSLLGCMAVIHLAWDTETDNAKSNHTNPYNLRMAQYVYRAAAEQKVRRVIIASSIHADMTQASLTLRSPYAADPQPDSPYGETKLKMERLGKEYADQGLEVVCIRFGWVSPNESDRPPRDKPYPANEGWISHGDCIRLVEACLSADEIPNNYQILWGLSWREEGGIHELRNPLWTPQDLYMAPLPPA